MLKRGRGFSLIELMVTISLVAILLALVGPGFSNWIRDGRIRAAAEGVLNGLQVARSEALRRNTLTRFQLMNTLDSSCALSTTGTNWIISIDDASGKCDLAASETVAPRTIQSRSGQEGGINSVSVSSNLSSITFNGLGRVASGTALTIDFSMAGNTCRASGGAARCLRVTVSINGQVRMCDPSLAATKPQGCS